MDNTKLREQIEKMRTALSGLEKQLDKQKDFLPNQIDMPNNPFGDCLVAAWTVKGSHITKTAQADALCDLENKSDFQSRSRESMRPYPQTKMRFAADEYKGKSRFFFYEYNIEGLTARRVMTARLSLMFRIIESGWVSSVWGLVDTLIREH